MDYKRSRKEFRVLGKTRKLKYGTLQIKNFTKNNFYG